MKATKLFLVIAFFAFATMSYANNDPAQQKVVKISLKKAMESRGLVNAIHHQIDWKAFLSNEHDAPYIAIVYFMHVRYAISGTYEEWVKFFLKDPGGAEPDVLPER